LNNPTKKSQIAAKFVIKGLCHRTNQTKLQYIHVDLGCQKGFHLALFGWMPDWHSIYCCQVGAHHLVAGVINKNPNLGKAALTKYFGLLKSAKKLTELPCSGVA
jgi:hypothetical protein